MAHPTRPYNANMPGPGPAPPLPAGPPPPQQYGQPQNDQAAHAAAWAAYYQSQGVGGSGYAAAGPSQPHAAQPSAPNAGAPNPYANYGYGAGTQHNRPQGPGQGGYRPPAGQNYNQQRPPQTQQFGPQPPYNPQVPGYGQGYQAPGGQGYQAGYNQNQPMGNAYQPQGPPSGSQQGYRPPPGPQQGYNAQQQPYRPQSAGPQQTSYSPTPRPPGNQPFRPSPSPSPVPPQHRPTQPGGLGNRLPSGPGRPPQQVPQSSFPPAKRPRFDGPQGMAAGGAGRPPAIVPPRSGSGVHALPNAPIQMQARTPPRPPAPSSMPNRPVGPNMGQPGFNVRPPSGPSASGSVPNGPSASRAPSSSLPAPPVSRPPIHLGLGGPPPSLPFGGSIRGATNVSTGPVMRNGMATRGGRGGMVNAPRGPAVMRRSDVSRSNKEADRKRRDKDRDRERDRDREAKTTMTDFRIVGIELKEIEWSWGAMGDTEGDATDVVTAKKEESPVKPEVEGKEGVKDEALASKETGPEPGSTEPIESADVKKENGSKEEEPVTSAEPKSVPLEPVDSSDTVEEKRGEKRKAKSPEGEEEQSASKKRTGEYILTHGRPNDTASSSRDSNQNRFRIYFESLPELDRVPKALRRNPNKRWRREESGSVAPSVTTNEVTESVLPTATIAGGIETVEEEAAVTEQETAKTEEGKPVEDMTGELVGARAPMANEQKKVPVQETLEDEGLVGVDGGNVEEPGNTEGANNDSAPLAADGSQTGTEQTPANGEQARDEGSQDSVVETVEASAPSAEAGDISMLTDPGAIESAINELVDGTEVTAEVVNGAKGEGDVGVGDAAKTEAAQKDTEESAPATTEQAEQEPADSGPTAQATSEQAIPSDTKVDPASEAPRTSELESQALADSAENTASAYKTRTRRRSSVSSADSDEYPPETDSAHAGPSLNRLSILYEESSRRLCFDASVVEKVKIHRKEGKIEVVFAKSLKETKPGSDDAGASLPKGILVETYDSVDQRFVSMNGQQLENMWSTKSDDAITIPPLHKAFTSESSEGLSLTVHLNKKKPLSEPKWCRNNTADEWLIEQFGVRKAGSESGWKGKLEIVDPDPALTLQSILDTWVSSCSYGTTQSRKAFTSSLLSDPNDLLEILLRLTRGDRNPTAASTSTLGPLATAIRPDSPYASHQTHVSLAILAMYRLTTDYAAKAGEKSEVVNEKVNDIIKSLPMTMIHKSLEGLFREWGTGGK